MIGSYDTEADQIEALKKLWKEYGAPAIIGLVIGIAVLYGWRFYQSYKIDQEKAAAQQYQVVWDAIEAHKDFNTPLAELHKKYSNSIYSVLGSLMAAHEALAENKTNVAEEHLRWALDHSDKNIIQDIVRARLARVLIATGKPDEALKLLDTLNSKSYASVRDQTKGDAYVKLNNLAEARKAYESALMQSALPEENRRVLQMKLADL